MDARYSVSFITLGCAKNEVDTAHMKEALRNAGHFVDASPEQADAVIVNTCSFIQSATEESIAAILDVAELDNVSQDDTVLIVAGCMPARYGEDLESELAEVRTFVPCSKEDDIVAIVEHALSGRTPRGAQFAADEGEAYWETDFTSAEHPVSAYVKISDGCNRFCSYCTIPFIRGRYHSFPYETICDEIQKYQSEGIREIVLIAQDTGRWGDDFEEPLSLAWLMSSLAERFTDLWFRVMYIQPEGITDELINSVASYDNICSYFDIPLQHVVPGILKSMNRSGSRDEFVTLVERIRDRIPDVTLRTTLIAGFPGETEDDFEELCEFVEEGLFDYIGVFPYSREEGTRAYNLPNQVPDQLKLDRGATLRALADTVCAPLIASRVGGSFKVLVEGMEEDGQLFGRAMCQAPEVDGVTYLTSGSIGEIVEVTIADTLLYEMEAFE